MRNAYGILIAILAFVCPSHGSAQQQRVLHESYHFESTPRILKLENTHIISNTVSIIANGTKLSSDEYVLDVPSGTVKLLIDLKPPVDVDVSYSHLWFDVTSCMFRRRLIDHTGGDVSTQAGDKDTPPPPEGRPTHSPQLGIFGSKSIGLRTGTGSDLELNQTLNVHIDGYLNQNLRVTGVLSDQSRPEVGGISTSLGEVDKVTLQISSEKFAATVGDIDFKRNLGANARFNKALKGGRAEFRSSAVYADAVLGGIKSKHGRLKTFGSEGVSGPYRLLPDVGRVSVSILPGTESVWLNGRQLTRGIDADYQIDYLQGEITFSPRIAINARSRIEADFEYLDENYRQDFQAGSFTYGDTSSAIFAQFGVISQIDSKANPSRFALDDSDISILAAAGDSTRKAVRSGITKVQQGNGDYVRRIVGTDTMYVYVGSLSGDYQVSFEYFGPGNGDYEYVGGGIYRFVSKGGGAYLPGLRLPMPQRSDALSLSAMVGGRSVSCRVDGLISNHDRNLFSDYHDSDNVGSDLTGRMLLMPLGAGGPDDLGWSIQIEGQRSESDFFLPGQAYQIDRDRIWGLASDSVFNLAEALLVSQSFAVGRRGKIAAGWGTYRDRGFFGANRYSCSAVIHPQQSVSLSASRDDRMSEDLGHQLRSRLYENTLRAGWSRSRVGISAGWADETDLRALGSDSTGRASNTYSADISFAGLTSSMTYEERDLLKSTWHRQYDSRETAVGYSGSGGLSNSQADIYLSHRRVHYLYPDISVQTQVGASVDYRTGSYQSPFDVSLNYRVSRQGVDQTTESFVKLGEGEGNYRLEDGIYVQDPLGDYIRVEEVLNVEDVGVTLIRGFKLRTDPKNWKTCPRRLAFLRLLLLETRVRTAEQGNPGENVDLRWILPYVELFAGNRFSLDRTLRQTVNVSLSNRLSVFLSVDEIKREDFRRRPRSAEYMLTLLERTEIKLASRAGLSIEHRLKRHEQYSPSFGDARFTEYHTSSILTYKVASDLILIPKIGYLTDRSERDDLSVTMWESAIEVNQRVASAGRIGSELAYQHVTPSDGGRFIPYQYALGRRPGDNFQWRISAEFGLSSNISARLSYDGQKIPQAELRKTRHILSMSIRARF